MRLAINAVSSKRGGAVTYMANMLPELVRQLDRSDSLVVWRAKPGPTDDPWPPSVSYQEDPRSTGGEGAIGGRAYRLWFDQVKLPRILRRDRIDVLFSSANFGPLFCPCRQVLLVRNTAYFDPRFLARMENRRVRSYYRFQRWLTLRCIERADVTLFPSQAMLDLVAGTVGRVGANWRVASYGTRPDLLTPSVRSPVEGKRPLELLNVSLYSDQKNFGTLLDAVGLLQGELPGAFRLTTTAGFDRNWLGASPFFPAFRKEAALFRALRDRGCAREIEWRSYQGITELYSAADIFVFPSYTESFGHPLVEAMASGLPIVAADTPVNRELCSTAAIYFECFDARACADAIRRVARDPDLAARLRAAAILRSRDFTWERHVKALISAFRN
jgi:glycosyltransferase involved in cell wall biosynthesis